MVKQFVQLANGKEVFKDGQADSDEQGSSDEDDDADSVDVNDMLMPDSENEEDGESAQDPANGILQRSAFLTQIDKKELARWVYKLRYVFKC